MFKSTWMATAMVLVGCGGGTTTMNPDMGKDGAAAVTLPPAYITSSDGGTSPASLGCIGTRVEGAAPTVDTVVTGRIKDFQDNNPIVGATVSIFANVTQVNTNSPIATSGLSSPDGDYTITVPPGNYRVIMRTQGGKAITGTGSMVETIPTYEFDRVFDDKERVSVKTTTRDAIPGLVSVIPDTALGVIAGSIRDCDNKEMGGGKLDVMAASAYEADKLIFYFTKIGDSTLPTRVQKFTGPNGVFAALNVPVGTATVSAKVVIGSGDPKPLGTASIPVLAGSITIVDILPTKKP